ncbi:hypothetical protein TKK_0015725 [Trichogramma kaykai]
MQLNHSKRRIWEEDEKQFALGLYYKSPKAYKYLSDIFNLPCSTTIHEWVNNINLRPGEKNIQLYKQLQVKLKSKSFYEKQSVLMWDEMMIKPGLEFSSKYDILEGYEDLGSDVGGRSPKIATHVLVFMLGGLIHNWKQPFFYIPSAGPVSASNLIILINKVLELAFEVGFIIKHMVCDQSKGNQSTAEQLGITLENPSYTFNENKITFGFDVPHIIKCIRNNLISNNYKVDGNIVSWMPIKKLYELEKGKSCRAAPKLSKRHIEPNNFEKMKVSLAVQVFSHSVGAALMAATMNRDVGLNNTDLEIAGATSDFCINRIFDCLNARTSADSNPYRRGLSSKSTIVEDELKKSLAWLKLIYDPTKSPAFSNLILTINGILLLWDRLKAEGVSYLLTSHLNQDKLENFFGFVRERCGYNNNPTLTQCVKNIQYAVLVTVLMPAVGGNCESDDARLLISNFNKYTVDETGDLTDKIDEKVAEWFSNNEEYWVKLNSEDETADTSENTTGTLNDSHTTTASPTVQTSDTIDTHTDPNNTTSEIETYTLAPAPSNHQQIKQKNTLQVI